MLRTYPRITRGCKFRIFLQIQNILLSKKEVL